ncbi:MAG: preprotein translocase subunit YajC [Candidatus Kapaibacterium sp.]|jgi:preprotein translocase subunit YajC
MIKTLFAMAPGAGQGGGDSMWSMLIFFGAMFAIMYFLMIRPQKKKQQEHKKMIDGIKKGDKVITSTGIHGTVTDVNEDTFLVQIADNVQVRFEKAAVSAIK